ncbi:MAG: MASE1 domain-containing protein [Planctomycetes bacterium]|nr:MASE1 domain-containing protein [Planctomycetota bacterium]
MATDEALTTSAAPGAPSGLVDDAASPRLQPPAWRLQPNALDCVAFIGLLLLSTFARENEHGELKEAIVWLPTGVAIAGLWILGARAWWCVAISAAALRVYLDYGSSVIVPGALGSAAEALLGAWMLERMRVDPSFSRLRDVVSLFVIAAIAPLASIGFSWIARALPHEFREMPFYSGWDGWWRMNALGVLVIVPVVGTWFCAKPERISGRSAFEAGAIAVVMLLVLGVVMALAPPGPLSILQLYLVLPVALFAAVRFGPRGAAASAALAGLLVAVGTSYGIGPFLSVAADVRHVAAQTFELSLVGVPLVCGALIAERELALASRLSADSLRRALQRFLPDTAYRIRGDGTIVDIVVPSGENHGETKGDTSELGPHELVGRPVEALGSAALAADMRRDIRATLEGAPSEPHDYRMTRAGHARMYEARYVRIGANEVLCLLRDVTRRRRTERLLVWEAEVLELVATGKASSEVLGRLLRGIEELSVGGHGSVLLLEGTRLYQASPNSLPAAYNAQIEGVEIGPLVGSCGTAAYHGRTVIVRDIANDPLWTEFADLALEHGLRACWSVPIRAASGRVLGSFAIYYREVREPLPEELAVVERAGALAGIALDRERREDLLASITRDLNEGIFRTTPDRGLIYVNDAFVRMFGYDSAEELLQVPPGELYADPSRREDMQRELVARGAVSDSEVLLRRRDGSTFVGLVRGVARPGSSGSAHYFDGAVSDVTVRKQLEDQLRQAQKMEAVGRLAGGVAHDFTNLLTAITGCAESLLDQAPSEGRARLDAREILRAAERGAALTRQLLAYSRQQVLAPQIHDMNRVVDELGAMLRRLIGEHIRLAVEHGGVHAFVKVDRGQIEQVVLNLALNARDAMALGGTLRITTTRVRLDDAAIEGRSDAKPGVYVCLSVEDSGVGMDANTRSRAFDPFFTTKELGKGTGLGLSTVQGIVHQSGGWVDLQSALGAGTKVRVYLPAVDEPAAPLPKLAIGAGSEQRAPETGTILVVEDEEIVRDLITWALRQAGFTVLEAENGERALEVARQTTSTIDLLVSDVVMPGMGGRMLAQRLRELRPGLRVLFVSGYTTDALPVHVDGEPGTEYLQKPFTRSELLGKLQGLLALPK